MRKNVWYLFVLVGCLFVWTACSDDDDKNKGWEGLSGTYEGPSKLDLKLNDVTLPVGNKSVVVEATSADNLSLTLNNVVPENKTLTIGAALTKTQEGVYTFSGTATAGEDVIAVSGTIDRNLLTIVVNRKVDSPVTGTWNLAFVTEDNSRLADVYVDIVTGNGVVDGAIRLLAAPALGKLIADKVEAVTVMLGENGILSFTWRKIGETEDTTLPETIAKAISLQYCIVNDRLLVAIDKNYVELLAPFLSKPLATYGLTIDDITRLLVDMGGYYGIPVDMKIEGNQATFYVTKAFILPAVEVLKPILLPLVPEDRKELINMLLTLLPDAKTVDVGLVFDKK